MNRIKVLPDAVKKKIAAGEVVEGPFSVVKELLENAIDAGSTEIDIHLWDSGLKKIQVSDNGSGIVRDDIELAVAEHATSKIEDVYDIEKVSSYGFRGEALSSISSVSRLSILSRRADEDTGAKIVCTDREKEVFDYAGPSGTTIIVENLFYNVPARKKFLKTKRTELRYAREIVLKTAIPHPGTAFSFSVDGERHISLKKTGSIDERIQQVYGKNILKDLIHERLQDLKVSISGFFSKPYFLKSSRTMQIFYINNRPVEYKYLGFLLTRAYEAVAPKGQHPVGIIFLDIDPELVDVNIHPAKREVKIFDQKYIDSLVMGVAEKALNRRHEVEPAGKQGISSDPGRIGIYSKNGGQSELPGYSPGRQGGLQFPETGRVEEREGPARLVKEAGELYKDISEIQNKGQGRKILGSVFNTYLLLEEDGALVIIDFHAAHERIIYDTLLEKGSSVETQNLAFPEIIELSIEDFRIFIENRDVLSNFGFDVDEFGDNSVAMNGVPVIASSVDARSLLLEFIESVKDEKEKVNIHDTVAATVACHSAKRAGDTLTTRDIEILTEEALSGEHEMRCPHGRPFVYSLGKKDLERMFKR